MNNSIFLLLAALAASLATSGAFTSPYPQCGCPASIGATPRAAPLYATDAAADPNADAGCGPGFRAIDGADGPCCAFDFDEVSSQLPPSVFDENPTLRTEYDDKNAARRKFGLPSLTPEEFVVLRAQLHALEREEGARQAAARRTAVEQREKERRARQEKLEKSAGPFQSFFGNFQSTCQSNFDCERPEVCCDFGFRKVCCSEGTANRDIGTELALIRVPQR